MSLEVRMKDIRLNNSREKFFPGWHLYSPGLGTVKPVYRIVCETWQDYVEARLAKPAQVIAKIFYKPRKSAA